MKIALGAALVAFASLLAPSGASARVFDFKSESFSVYFGGTFGSSRAGGGAYSLSSGPDTSFDKQVASATSGEVGFSIATSRATLRLGAEYLMPREQAGVTGSDAGGTALFSLTSKIAAFIPQGNLEFLAYKGSTSRAIFGGGFGIALVTLDNSYTMTSDGQSAFGVGDYVESGRAQGAMAQAYAGYEILFTDTTTAAFTLGHRWLNVSGFTATKGYNGIGGTVQETDVLRNSDGGERSLDLGGFFAGVTFRFYL